MSSKRARTSGYGLWEGDAAGSGSDTSLRRRVVVLLELTTGQ